MADEATTTGTDTSTEDTENSEAIGVEDEPTALEDFDETNTDVEYLRQKLKEVTEHSRKWERRAKQNMGEKKTLAEQAKKSEEVITSQQTETKTIAERIAKLEKENQDAKSELYRHKVASAKGIPTEALSFLTGTTEEEVSASADAFLAAASSLSKASAPTVGPIKTQATGGIPSGLSPREQFILANSDKF